MWEGSDGVGAGRDGVDKWCGSWRKARDVQAAEAATRKPWASIDRRRKRQTARKHEDKLRSWKRTRRAFEACVADRNVGARVDAREQRGYGLRGRDDTDECFAEHEYDTIWGDTVVASRREPCASPPVKKLDLEAVAQRLPALPSLEASTPAPGSVLKAAAETPAPLPVVRKPAFGAPVGYAALPTKKLDFEAIELEAKAMQVSFSERLGTAAPFDKSAGQLVVGKTILGHTIANDEPLYGGKCAPVALLTGVVPPCLGGSVTIFDDAPEALYYAIWDDFEEYPDKACDVRYFDLTGSAIEYRDISSLRELLGFGPSYKLHGNRDLQTFLAERREPLGYTKTGRLLLPPQNLIFMVAASVFMQCDIVMLDRATAMPLYAIVRCQGLNSRRQRTASAARVSRWVRIWQVVKGSLGRKVLSLKTTPGREKRHVEGVSMSASGLRIIDGLLARFRDQRAELMLAADERAVVETMLEYHPPVEGSVGVLQMAGDDKKPIICSDCGKVHPTRATVKSRPGGLVCVSDCGLLTEGRRKRPAEGSGPPPPSKKRTQLAFSDEEQPPPPSTTYKQPSTVDAESGAGRLELVSVGTVQPPVAAMPPSAPQCASLNEPPPALLVQDMSKERPPIDEVNAGSYQPPRLDVHRSAAERGPGSKPALWFKQVLPRPSSIHAPHRRLLMPFNFHCHLVRR